MNATNFILSIQIKRLTFFINSLFLFFSVLFFFLLSDTGIVYSHCAELVIFWLICIGLPANRFISGTGALIFSFFCVVLMSLSTLIFSRFSFLAAVPLFILLQLIYRRQCERISETRRSGLLEIEKIKEKLNEKKQALEHLNLKKKSLEIQIQRFSNLRNYISQLNFALSKEDLSDRILHFVNENLPHADLYSLFLFNPKREPVTTHFIVRENREDVHLRPDQQDILNEWVMNYRSPLRINDVLEDYRFQIKGDVPLFYPLSRSIIASPLISDNKPMGVIRIDSKNPNQFHINEFRMLVIIANISALSLRNSELFKQTEKLAVTDGLTGLYLPHFLFETISNLISQNQDNQQNSPFSLLMMDLDHFKRINDTFGHVVGDHVLMQTSAKILKNIPKSGLAIRYGGEEFAVLLEGMGKKEAFCVAEKIRKSFDENPLTLRRESIHLTLSIGVSSFPEDGKEGRILVQKADEMLYLAKKQGRNRTVVIP
ncbi:MAG: sensor domain-containing diguanylate cyclase [Candidatus Aureabacteria bacterium]|nr:sensor domain-containing diguanylate cyclase [Candidatus Auribacterota bacterium]